MIKCPNCSVEFELHDDTRTLWRIGNYDYGYSLSVSPKDEFVIFENKEGKQKLILTYRENVHSWFGIKKGKIVKINMHTFPTIIKEYEKL